LDNLILHLLCTALVWFFSAPWVCPSGGAVLPLCCSAFIRCVWNPWHGLPNAKIVLYGFFYLSALLAYIRYLASGKTGYFLLTFLLFVLSLFSKGQAVALPFSLVLLDWYFDRKIDRKAMTEN